MERSVFKGGEADDPRIVEGGVMEGEGVGHPLQGLARGREDEGLEGGGAEEEAAHLGIGHEAACGVEPFSDQPQTALIAVGRQNPGGDPPELVVGGEEGEVAQALVQGGDDGGSQLRLRRRPEDEDALRSRAEIVGET